MHLNINIYFCPDFLILGKMNLNEEGKYYASMVRKFRTEYKSKNLHGFCKEQKVNYTKMLHCLRNDFFLKDNKKAFILWLNVPKVTAY